MSIDFERVSRLGKGTYGAVYSVKRTTNNPDRKYKIDNETHYALKTFFTNTPSKDSVDSGVFSIREIQYSLLLEHPNVCKARQALYEKPFRNIGNRKKQRNDKAFLLFDTAQMDLEKFLFEYSLPQNRIYEAVIQISSGLKYIHDQGLMHRDIKLNNILMYSDEGTGGVCYKLADFGCIKPISRCGKETPRDVTHLEYRAPEQLMERDDYGLEVDLWAMGVLMFELITGYTPFRWEEPDDYANKEEAAKAAEKYLTNRQQLRRVLRITGAEGIEVRDKDSALPLEGNGNKKKLRKFIDSNISEIRNEDFDAEKENWEVYVDLIVGLLALIPANRYSLIKILETVQKQLIKKEEVNRNKEEDGGPRSKKTKPPTDKEDNNINIANNNNNKSKKTYIKVKESNLRSKSVEFIAAASINKRYHCHAIDIINRVTWELEEDAKRKRTEEELERDAAKLAFVVLLIVAKFWKIEDAPKLRKMFPDEKELIRSFDTKELDEYEKYLLRDVLKEEVYRPNLYMLLPDTVPWQVVEKLITGTDLNRMYVEDVARELESHYSKLSPPKVSPSHSPSRNMLVRNT